MRGAGNDPQLDGGEHARHRVLVELDHDLVVAADEEQRRRMDARELVPGQIRAPAVPCGG